MISHHSDAENIQTFEGEGGLSPNFAQLLSPFP